MLTANGKEQLRRIRTVLFAILLVIVVPLLTSCEDIEGGQGGEAAVSMDVAAKSCWTCSFFTLAFEAVNKAATSIVPGVAGSAVGLIGVGFALWIAITVLKLVGSLKEADTAGFWKAIGTQAFLVCLCAGLLKDLQGGSSSSVIKIIMEPIFSGFVDIGLLAVGKVSDVIPACPTGSPQAGLVCLVTALHEKLSIGFGLPTIVLSVFIPSLILPALTILCAVSIMCLYFPILLLDTVFRYGLLLCMTPLFVSAYAFKVTRSFCGLGMNALIEIGMQIVSMSIFVAIAATVLNDYVDQNAPYLRSPIALIQDPKLIISAMTGSGIIGFIFISFFLILFAGVLFELMQKFGGMGGGSVVGDTIMKMRDMGNGAAHLASFAKNRHARSLDKKAQDDIENLKDKKNLTDKEKDKLAKAKDRMEERGYTRNGKNTQAYNQLKNRGLAQGLSDLSADWNDRGSNQRNARYDADNNVEV